VGMFEENFSGVTVPVSEMGFLTGCSFCFSAGLFPPPATCFLINHQLMVMNGAEAGGRMGRIHLPSQAHSSSSGAFARGARQPGMSWIPVGAVLSHSSREKKKKKGTRQECASYVALRVLYGVFVRHAVFSLFLSLFLSLTLLLPAKKKKKKKKKEFTARLSAMDQACVLRGSSSQTGNLLVIYLHLLCFLLWAPSATPLELARVRPTRKHLGTYLPLCPPTPVHTDTEKLSWPTAPSWELWSYCRYLADCVFRHQEIPMIICRTKETDRK
jgi:hypothetical protein